MIPGIGTSNTPYVYKVQVNDILITLNSHLLMMTTIHLKNETEPDQVLNFRGPVY